MYLVTSTMFYFFRTVQKQKVVIVYIFLSLKKLSMLSNFLHKRRHIYIYIILYKMKLLKNQCQKQQIKQIN